MRSEEQIRQALESLGYYQDSEGGTRGISVAEQTMRWVLGEAEHPYSAVLPVHLRGPEAAPEVAPERLRPGIRGSAERVERARLLRGADPGQPGGS